MFTPFVGIWFCMLGTSEVKVEKEVDAEGGEKDSSPLNGNFVNLQPY